MSKTATVSVGERLFWALDDAFSVWFEYVIDQIELTRRIRGWWNGPRCGEGP